MREYDLSLTQWRKSSYSDDNGGSCLEVADGVTGTVPVRDSKVPDGPVLLIGTDAWTAFVSNARWRKSSHSNGEGGNCLEVADGVARTVPVRDSKVPDGPVLLIGADAWTAFVAGVAG